MKESVNPYEWKLHQKAVLKLPRIHTDLKLWHKLMTCSKRGRGHGMHASLQNADRRWHHAPVTQNRLPRTSENSAASAVTASTSTSFAVWRF